MEEAEEESVQVVEEEAVVVGWIISVPAGRASMLRAASWPTARGVRECGAYSEYCN